MEKKGIFIKLISNVESINELLNIDIVCFKKIAHLLPWCEFILLRTSLNNKNLMLFYHMNKTKSFWNYLIIGVLYISILVIFFSLLIKKLLCSMAKLLFEYLIKRCHLKFAITPHHACFIKSYHSSITLAFTNLRIFFVGDIIFQLFVYFFIAGRTGTCVHGHIYCWNGG